MQAAIVARGLTKKFTRNQHQHKRYALRSLFAEIRGHRSTDAELRQDEFYAVDDLSFTVAPGEAIALIGRNGCGKSTTLRMITGLIKPDRGSATVHGRVQALIALGTGFNDQLSGRENVYISAAALGLRRKETRAIINDVIDFAELDEFIDSPVCAYSSGMKARLGFSVAVHLKPDILIVDEILGVGDAAFQNKCYQHIRRLQQRGVTMLIVTHSHARVVQICDRAIWLDRGRLRQGGPAKDVVQNYIDFLAIPDEPVREAGGASPGASAGQKKQDGTLFGPTHAMDERLANLHCRTIVGDDAVADVVCHGAVAFEYDLDFTEEIAKLNVTLGIWNSRYELVSVFSTLNGDVLEGMGRHPRVRIDVPDFCLVPDRYTLVMSVHEGHAYLYRGVMGHFVVRPPQTMTWGMVDLPHAIRAWPADAEDLAREFVSVSG